MTATASMIPPESVPVSDSNPKRPDYAGSVDRVQVKPAESVFAAWTAARDKHVASLKRQAGTRLASCRFSTFETSTPYQRTVVETLRSWADSVRDRLDTGEGLVLYGPVGTGKDHLAFAAVGEAVFKLGCTVRWVNGRELMGQIRDRISEDASENELMTGLAAPKILVISDPLPPIGDLTQHQADMLYRVCDRRYGSRSITVVTLNVADDAEADKRIGAATWDRLCHGAWKVACMWESYRRPAKDIHP